MPKVNKDVKKAFIQTILGHFSPKEKPDFITANLGFYQEICDF